MRKLPVATTAYNEGPNDASICIVAEAPARTEIALNRPLVGPSGEVFNWALAQSSLRRGSLKILNVFPFEVIKRDNGKKMFDKHSNTLLWDYRGLTRAGEEAAEPFFQRLEKWSGSVLVPMGNTALHAVADKLGVEKWRGSPLVPSEADMELLRTPGLKWIIPTLHPAATLEHRGRYHMRHVLKADLEKAKRFAGGYQPKERELILDPSFKEAKDFLRECGQAPRFATDVEIFTNRSCISCFSLALDPWTCISIPVLNGEGEDRWNLQEEVEIWDLMAKAMDRPDVEIINQNILFDCWVYWTYHGFFPRGNLSDPMIAQAVMFPDFPKNLGFLGSLHTDVVYYKMDGGRAWYEGKGDAKDIGIFWRYSALDSGVAMEAWVGNDWTPGLGGMLEPHGYQKTYDMAITRLPLLLYKMSRGMAVDMEAWEEADATVTQQIGELERALREEVGYPLSVTSPKQCQAYFYDECGREPYVNKMTGRPTTDDKALARIVRAGGKGAKAAEVTLNLRAKRTLKSRYLDVTWDPDGRLRCSWNPAGTNTGRLSSGTKVDGAGTNFQNLPPEFRGFLVADADEEMSGD